MMRVASRRPTSSVQIVRTAPLEECLGHVMKTLYERLIARALPRRWARTRARDRKTNDMPSRQTGTPSWAQTYQTTFPSRAAADEMADALAVGGTSSWRSGRWTISCTIRRVGGTASHRCGPMSKTTGTSSLSASGPVPDDDLEWWQAQKTRRCAGWRSASAVEPVAAETATLTRWSDRSHVTVWYTSSTWQPRPRDAWPRSPRVRRAPGSATHARSTTTSPTGLGERHRSPGLFEGGLGRARPRIRPSDRGTRPASWTRSQRRPVGRPAQRVRGRGTPPRQHLFRLGTCPPGARRAGQRARTGAKATAGPSVHAVPGRILVGASRRLRLPRRRSRH